MQKLSVALLFAIGCSLVACKGHSKTILVYANSNIKADATNTNITVGDGTTHREQELSFVTGDPVTLNVTTGSGKLTLSAPEDGLYIANLKNDTVIGSMQHVGADADSRITQEALKAKLDSLQQLVNNQNVNAANKNYYLLPNTIAKISGESKAKVFGPFTTIPGSFDAGSVPEIYKFYSIKEIRDIIAKLSAMTGEKKPEAPASAEKK